MKVKTPRNSLDHKGVVYSIPCETGRTLTERMSEHKRAVKNGDSNNALAVHVKQSGHNIQWEEANILIREGHWTKRKIKEGIAIKEKKNNESGQRIPNRQQLVHSHHASHLTLYYHMLRSHFSPSPLPTLTHTHVS